MAKKIQQLLREQGYVDFEGVRLYPVPGKDDGRYLVPGDMYVAERNSGPKLLTVKRVDFEGAWVECVERAYSFDFGECVGVTFTVQ